MIMKAAKQIIFTVLLVCLTVLSGCGSAKQSEVFSGVEFIMDTFVEQRWYGKNAQQNFDEINQALRDIEQRLSMYYPESEISKLNKAAGKHPVAISDESYSLLKEAVQYCGQSGGIFDITVAPLTGVWNVTASEPQIPSDKDIETARLLVNYKDIIFDDSSKTVMLAKEGMSIDLGGIAKGYAAGAVRSIAQKNGVEGYVSIGGNIMMHGKKPDGKDFIIGVRDPRGDAAEYIATVDFDGLIMATTGDYERYFEKDGVRYHHIIDPFTGRPSESDLISVTVFSENGTLSDCFSTMIFLKGSEGLPQFLEREDCMIIAVTKDKDVYISPSLEDRVKPNPAKTDYHFVS